MKIFFEEPTDKKYKARFQLFCRKNQDYMSFSEMIEFLTSINIIMSEKILHSLYNALSEVHDNQGITYDDVRIVIIKKK